MNNHRNIGFGNLSSLKKITITNQKNNDDEVEDESATNNTTYYTKIMRISPEIFEKLRNHSHMYHPQPTSFDEIIDELVEFYNKEHEKKYF